jgi:hypothetical protein
MPAADGAMAALLREAVVTGRLEHPGIVPVHALGLDERGAPVLVMKRVEGVEWRVLLDDAEHHAWTSRPGDRLAAHLEILMQVCQAAHFAHSRGVIHCDIKPENVMLGDFGEVYLVDWGIALRVDDPSAKARGGLIGTPAYMAPELVAGNPVGPYTDVYLLGATLHHILTGRFRHDGGALQEALLSAFCSEPVDYGSGVSGELAEICNRAMRRDGSERFASALELRQALSDFLRHRGSIALADEARERLTMLRSLLDATPADEAPEDLGRAYQLVSESRFGFVQALKEWPENNAAQKGRDAVVLCAAELELRQGHLPTAEAMLAELHEVPSEVTLHLKRARKEWARTRAEEERLRAIAHDMDSSVAQKERTRGLAALFGASLAIGGFALSQPNPTHIKPEGLFAFAALACLIMAGAALLLRRRLMANAFSRKSVGLMVVAGCALLVSRGIGVWLRMPAPLILTQDLLLLAGIAAASSIVLLRWLWPLAALLVAGAVWCLKSPGISPVIFALVSVFFAPLLAIAVWKHRQDEERARADVEPESTLLE